MLSRPPDATGAFPEPPLSRIHLDLAATTPLDPRVRAAMEPFQAEDFGNPSSPHRAGVRAAEALDQARRQVARAVGARPARVVFTAGGTEANNLAVLGISRAARGRHVLVGATEHASVSGPAQALVEEGYVVETLPLDSAGALDLDAVERLVRPDTVLVAHMLVNNEVGSVYPLAQLARRVRARASGARIHVDAVQALGKLEVSLTELGIDSLSLSAHKFHGPKGAGALVLAGEMPLRPLVFGGGQEGGLRSGTEAVAALVGLGAAVELAEAERPGAVASMLALRESLVAGLERLPGARVLEPGAATQPLLASIVAVRLPGPPAEVWLHHLDARGVSAGVGSACQAREGRLSPTLLALGLTPAQARNVLRFSFSRDSRPGHVAAALEALTAVHQELEAVRR
jgi:cysteine desulfurase